MSTLDVRDDRLPSMATSISSYHDAKEFATSAVVSMPSPIEEHHGDDDARSCTYSDDSRRDSGYESLSHSSTSSTPHKQTPSRRVRDSHRARYAASTSGHSARDEREPRRGRTITRSNHRSTASVPTAHFYPDSPQHRPKLQRATSSLYRPSSSHQHPPNMFFYFPAPEIASPGAAASSASSTTHPASRRQSLLMHDGVDISAPAAHEPAITPLPTTTCYWTSNQRRREEYAAIDAASRGVKGWVRKNLMPAFLVPNSAKQHVAFDDDTGSVRRYRIDIDEEDEDEDEDEGVSEVEKERQRRKSGKKKGTWAFLPFKGKK